MAFGKDLANVAKNSDNNLTVDVDCFVKTVKPVLIDAAQHQHQYAVIDLSTLRQVLLKMAERASVQRLFEIYSLMDALLNDDKQSTFYSDMADYFKKQDIDVDFVYDENSLSRDHPEIKSIYFDWSIN